MSPPSLACVMMTNNDTMLARAIESIRYHVDLVIVAVDSRADASVWNLLSALRVRSILMHWDDDFAKAINDVREKADADYSILLDSDEMILAHDAAKLRPLVESAELKDIAGYHSIQRHWKDLAMTEEFLDFGPCWPGRIFRRDVKLVGRAHQHSNIPLEKSDLEVHHFNLALNTPYELHLKAEYVRKLQAMPY